MAMMLSKVIAGFENRLIRLEVMVALVLVGVVSLIIKGLS